MAEFNASPESTHREGSGRRLTTFAWNGEPGIGEPSTLTVICTHPLTSGRYSAK